MIRTEQGQDLKQIEVKPELGAEGRYTLCIGFLFVLVSLGLLSGSVNVYE